MEVEFTSRNLLTITKNIALLAVGLRTEEVI